MTVLYPEVCVCVCVGDGGSTTTGTTLLDVFQPCVLSCVAVVRYVCMCWERGALLSSRL